MSLLIITDGKISDSLSTVPIQTVNDVTATKSIGVNYTNTTGKTLYISIYATFAVSVSGGTAMLSVQVPQATLLGWNGLVSSPVMTIAQSIFVIVKPDQTYRFNKSETNGLVTLTAWIESY